MEPYPRVFWPARIERYRLLRIAQPDEIRIQLILSSPQDVNCGARLVSITLAPTVEPCPCRKLNPNVLMMQSAQDRRRMRPGARERDRVRAPGWTAAGGVAACGPATAVSGGMAGAASRDLGPTRLHRPCRATVGGVSPLRAPLRHREHDQLIGHPARTRLQRSRRDIDVVADHRCAGAVPAGRHRGERPPTH